MEFIEKGPPPQGCVFCLLPRETEDRKNLILYRGEQAFVILNKFPYNNGHLMIVPNQHTADFTRLSAPVMAEMNALTQTALRALGAAYRPEGFNLGMNLGHAAGAGIREHLHLHIVPRWIGDSNFMPVVAEAKCMPQHLMTSYDQLAPQFQKGENAP
jgi:ATP adenylyltransferase